MEKAKTVSLSAAIFVVICFFLPWVQVSCGGIKDSASGFDLARGGNSVLWLIPCLMLVVVLLGLARRVKANPSTLALVGLVSGLVSAYLMNRKRIDTEDSSGILAAHVTGWFWLGLASSLTVAIAGLMVYLKRSRPTM